MSQKETKTNSETLSKENEDVVLKAVQKDGADLQYNSTRLKDDKEFILSADVMDLVRKDGLDLKPVGPVDPKPWENEDVLEAFRKYGWTWMYIKEMERFDEVCGDLEIEHTDSLFGKFDSVRNFEKSKTYGFTLTESELKQLREKAEEALKDENVKRIIEAYEAKGFDITGEDIGKSIRAKKNKEIIEICKANGIEITGNVFLKTDEEIEKIIEICKANGIEVTGSDLKQLLETEEEKENEQGRSR